MITSSIVTYNTSRNELERLIRCADLSIIDAIYIIDNSPVDLLKSFVQNLSPKIEYIFNNNNLGYGAAHNIALKKSIELKAKYHIILNPDIYFETHVIHCLKEYMNMNTDVGATMPKVMYPNGELQYLCKLQATPLDLLGRRFIPLKKYVEKRNYRYELRRSDYNQIMNVPCLSGCFMFLRVSALEDVGMFDDSYFMYCEDFDFYKRIHQKYKTIFYPEVSIVHDHKKESYQNNKMLYMHIKSAIRYFNKWGWFFDRDRRFANKEIRKYLDY
ncbi:MAG: hypothetical protein RL662_569 [Bacteroidota bacterium]|jgi:GT2 family glycosyltransferase